MIIALQYDILLVGNRQGVFFGLSYLFPLCPPCRPYVYWDLRGSCIRLTWEMPRTYIY